MLDAQVLLAGVSLALPARRLGARAHGPPPHPSDEHEEQALARAGHGGSGGPQLLCGEVRVSVPAATQAALGFRGHGLPLRTYPGALVECTKRDGKKLFFLVLLLPGSLGVGA